MSVNKNFLNLCIRYRTVTILKTFSDGLSPYTIGIFQTLNNIHGTESYIILNRLVINTMLTFHWNEVYRKN